MEALISHVETSFANAEKMVSKLPDEILQMEGFSGKKTRHFYNNLLSLEGARYLEIGTFKGSSVCSAMYGNKAYVTCIDNFSEFDGPRNEFLANFASYKGDNDAHFVEAECFSLDVSTLPTFNIYMYDGDHKESCHRLALTHYISNMTDIFIYVVDDWNWECVRAGTLKAIQELGLTTLYEKEIRLTWDDTHTPQPLASETWHNGIYVAVLKKPTL
jgi:hypothetical protein